MNTTDFAQIIKDLRDSGMTDAQIARFAKCTRQYIGSIGKGETNNVNYEIGRKLAKLHEAVE